MRDTNIDNTTLGLGIENLPSTSSNDQAPEEQSPAEREMMDNESVYSRFSDSSSDEEADPTTDDNEDAVTAPATPIPTSSEFETRPARRTTLSWDDLNKLDLGDPDDPDADEKMRTALRREENPDADAETKAQWRIQEEERRGYYYVNRPRCIKTWFGEDIARSSRRAYWGSRLSEADMGVRLRRTVGWTKRPSPLRQVRSADDLSPEEPEDVPEEAEDDLQLKRFGQPAFSGLFVGEDPFANAAEEEDDGKAYEEAPTTQEATGDDDTVEGTSTLPLRPAAGKRPELHISTSPAAHEAHITTTDAEEDEEPAHSATSAEELEQMTQMSPTTAYEKLRELYAHLKSTSFADAQETLSFKRKLLLCEKKNMMYSALDDDVPRYITEKGDETMLDMYLEVSGHLYRVQRDEYRMKAMEEYEMRKELEKLRREEADEISMLKFEFDQRAGAKEKLEETRRALKQKTEEAGLWKKAHERVASVAKEAYDRKEMQCDASTQTAPDLHPVVLKSNEKLKARNAELDKENGELQRTIDELRKERRELISRNDLLEERVEESDTAWQDLLDSGVDVSERKAYLANIRAENTLLKDDNGRLRKVLTEWKMWQEKQEKENVAASKSSPAAVESISVPSTTPATSLSLLPGQMMKPHWIEREEQIRNSESFKRNVEAIERHFALEAEKSKKAEEAKW